MIGRTMRALVCLYDLHYPIYRTVQNACHSTIHNHRSCNRKHLDRRAGDKPLAFCVDGGGGDGVGKARDRDKRARTRNTRDLVKYSDTRQ